MSILVWGSTPLAAGLAASLPSGVWLTDAATREAVENGGLTLDGRRVEGLKVISEYSAEPRPDLVVLAAPNWYTAEAIRILFSAGSPPPPILFAALGLGGLQRLESAFGADNVLQAVITRQFAFDTPNSVTSQTGGGAAVQSDHPQTELALKTLASVGLETQKVPKDSLQWSSVFWGIQGNAIASILDIPHEVVYRSPELFGYEYTQLREALEILGRLDVKLVKLPGVNVPLIAQQIRWIPRRLLPAFLLRHPAPPSLRADLAQRRSDAAYLNGAIAIQADANKLQAPANHALALTLTDIAEGRALWSQYKDSAKILGATIRLAKG